MDDRKTETNSEGVCVCKMGTLTEEFLLRKKKTASLESIENLSLRNHSIKELDVAVFSKLTSLRTLDLAHNELKEIPAGLVLKKLTYLDVSENRLTSAAFVSQFPQLKAVCLAGNAISKDEKYAAMISSKTLKGIDRESVDTTKSLVSDFTNRLNDQIEGVYHGMNTDETDAKSAADKFLKALDNAKLEGAQTGLPKFQRLLTRQLGEKLLKDLALKTSGRRKRVAAENNTLVCSRTKRSASPDEGVLQEQSPNKSARLSTRSGSAKTPPHPAKSGIPKKTLKSPSKKSSVLSVSQLMKRNRKQLPEVAEYDPQSFIRCHFGGSKRFDDNDPRDKETVVWSCLFEPDPHKEGKDTGVVATCGGNVVCLIDTKTGRIKKRFKQDKEGGQNFFAMAWTTISLSKDGREWPTNILAVGGINGEVNLLHPDQLVSYDEFSINSVMQTYCTALLFHPAHPTVLFCGDDTGRSIFVFDIGIPTGKDYKTKRRELCRFKMNGTSTNKIVYSKKTNCLIVATHKGIFGWEIGTKVPRKNRDVELQFVLPSPAGFVDGLTEVSDDVVACKVVNHGCVYLFRPSAALAGQRSKHFPSRVKVPLLAVLNWASTDDIYLDLSCRNGLLSCGDHMGRIWLYNVRDVLNGKTEESDCLFEPSRVLQWPECDVSAGESEQQMTDVNDPKQDIVVISAAISENGQYVVLTTMTNMVGVWKKV